MVGPPSAADRARDRRLMAAGLVGLVAVSAGLTAAHGGATLAEVALLGAAGLVVGTGLALTLAGWP
jgi:hypothetical protein